GRALGAVLQQDQGKGLQPVAFLSKKMLDAETRYPTHEKELLAIICALKTWRHYLHGKHFTVKTDHKSLQYLQTQPQLSDRQSRWKDIIANFDFTIEYIEGSTNVVADALSRRSEHSVPVPADSVSVPVSVSAISVSAADSVSVPVSVVSQHSTQLLAMLRTRPHRINHITSLHADIMQASRSD